MALGGQEDAARRALWALEPVNDILRSVTSPLSANSHTGVEFLQTQ